MGGREEDSVASSVAGGTLRAPGAAATPHERFAHLRSLDGLRGVAVLAVVVYHFAPGFARGGFLGVDLFFVLSGFLITSLLVSEWGASQRVSLSRFWLRRARRLLPALFLVLGVVAGYELVTATGEELHRVGNDGLWSLCYLANWHFIATGQSYAQQILQVAPSPLRHLWSLAVEEQFYLVWPLVVVGIGALAGRGSSAPERRTRRVRVTLLAFCAVAGAASCARMIALYIPGTDPSRVYYGTDTRVFIILAGAALGVISVGTPTVPRAARIPVQVVGVAAASVLAFMMATLTATSSFLYEGGYLLVALLMVATLVAAAQPGPNPIGALFRWKPLVGLGLISYGVYLWHWPIGLWLDETDTGLTGAALFVARCACTLLVALASYYLVEMPIRSGGLRRLGRIPSTLVPVVGVASVAALIVIPAASSPSIVAAPPHPKVARSATIVSTVVTQNYASAPRCDGGAPPVPLDPTRTLRVQLVGNSVAQEVRGCLQTILAARQATLEGASPSGFLFCNQVPDIERQVRAPATRPDAAVLFAFIGYDPDCGAPWHGPVDELVSVWKRAGTHVFLVPSVPFIAGTAHSPALDASAQLESAYYRQLAAEDPEDITYLDAGQFIRDASGTYTWRMPCLPGGEAGCDTDDTVAVRFYDGLHFCGDERYYERGCTAPQFEAGERRVATSIAVGLIPALETLYGR